MGPFSTLFSELPVIHSMCLELAPIILLKKLGNLGSVVFTVPFILVIL